MSRTALVVVALLTASVASACTDDAPGDGGPSARAGDVLPAELQDQIEGRHSYVVVPGLRYDFTVSRPTDRIDTITADRAGIGAEAGDDVRYVGVTWDTSGQLGDTFVMEPDGTTPATLSLLVDGEPTEVGDLREEGFFGAYVAVPADTDDIGLAVEYDGLVQTVEDAYDPVAARPVEPASLYLEAPAVRSASCPRPRRSGKDPRVSVFGTGCTAQVSTPIPYYGPLGWAPGNDGWVVVRTTVAEAHLGPDLGDDYVDYEVTTAVRLTLDGQEPVELFPLEDGEPAGEQDDGSWAAVAVFRVGESGPDGPPVLRREYVAVPEDDDPPAGAPATIRRTQRDELR